MLAMSAQGFDTCPMEGFDKNRVAKILKLKGSSNIVMVISAGKRANDGVWGERIRFAKTESVFVV
jgi:nitroreductase